MHVFTRLLQEWHQQHNQRELPWKGERDPYKIWLSEIILQQTRAEQGRPYYLRFIDKYPNLATLAKAPEEEVFKLWQGLGYYSRCKNMLAAARKIIEEFGGLFPNDYTKIRSLPGVGDYTAAAISSFAFDLPYAVVDGNVIRVLARFFRIDENAYSSKGKKIFSAQATMLLNLDDPAQHNQAIMDLGAIVCTARNPKCSVCPLQKHCLAYQDGVVDLYPPPKIRPLVQERHLHYIFLRLGERTYMQQRAEGDIWAKLFEPFRLELPGRQNLSTEEISQKIGGHNVKFITTYKQRLTHRLVITHWYELQLNDQKDFKMLKHLPGKFFSKSELKKIAMPKSISVVMSKKNYF